MYDMHYDLLTILYFNLINNNKYSNKEKLINDLKQIYRNGNIKGGIINLYFMTQEEMKEELDISLEEMEDIETMFIKSIDFLKMMQNESIIPKNMDFIYSIEGCDYIKNPDTLERLYNNGLRAILPVWNHKNQYGSGNRTDDGLTDDGKKLIEQAMKLGIIIDLSHANTKTYNDIIDVYLKEKNDDSIIMASHSNVRALCNRERNLNDEQLIKLRDVGGYIGLFTNGNFLVKDNEQITYKERQLNFLKHLDYLIKKIKFNPDKIFISTDDMNFNPDQSYHHLEAFPINEIKRDIFNLISDNYDNDLAQKIVNKNASDLIHKVKNKRKS